MTSGNGLSTVAKSLLGWATPQTADGENSKGGMASRATGRRRNLVDQVHLLGWATPRARDHKNNGVSIARAAKGVADSLDLQCKLIVRDGTAPPSPLSARMDRGAYRLNPRFSLWLMGFPPKWWDAVPVRSRARATRSSRKSLRNS